MIFYGTNGSRVLAEQLDRTTCINCNEQSVAIVTFSRYAHIYWIPLFPIGKVTATECTNCRQVFEGDAIPESYQMQVEYQKVKAKTPIWHFAGLAIIAVAIIIGVVSSNQNDKENKAQILAPQVGDKYEVKYSSSEYTVWRVVDVNADTVYIVPSNYTTNKLSGLSNAKFNDDSEYDDSMSFGLTSASLLTMLEENKIVDVNR